MVSVDRGCGYGLPGGPRFRLPCIKNISEDAARRMVNSSPLAGLEPGAPGVSSKNWLELAAVATKLPDIRWLGRQVHGPWSSDPSKDYWNDYEIIHKGQTTDLSIEGHRLRLGEKALKYGGIDIVLRVMSVFGPDEQLGYHGVKDIFSTPIEGTREFLYFWPRTRFFMQRNNWEKYIKPRLGARSFDRDGDLTPQAIANSMLILHHKPKTEDQLRVFRLIVNELGGRPVNKTRSKTPYLAESLYCTADTWTEMLGMDDFAGLARALWYLCANKNAPVFPAWCRGRAIYAECLLDAPDDLCEDNDGEEDDIFAEEDYSFVELVKRCVARRAFDNDGLRILCKSAGLNFQPFSDEETEEEKAARLAAKRSLDALAIASRELSRRVSRRSSGTPAASA